MRSASIVLAFLTLAGPSPQKPESPKPVPLELHDDPALRDGKVAIVGGEAGTDGVRYVLSKLSILQPVQVTLLSRESNPNLELLLHSPGWKDTVRKAGLEGKAWRTLAFRTQGDVGITIRSRGGRKQKFDLVAWVGSEVEPRMQEAVVSPEEYRKYAAARPDAYPPGGPPAMGGGETSPVLIVIAVALCGILVLLGLLVFRRLRP